MEDLYLPQTITRDALRHDHLPELLAMVIEEEIPSPSPHQKGAFSVVRVEFPVQVVLCFLDLIEPFDHGFLTGLFRRHEVNGLRQLHLYLSWNFGVGGEYPTTLLRGGTADGEQKKEYPVFHENLLVVYAFLFLRERIFSL